MRELFIHIGAGKTGTTALQFFFTLNKQLLRHHGITYPIRGSIQAQHRLAQSMIVNDENSFRLIKNLKTYQEEWKTTFKGIDSEKVLISSEYFEGMKDSLIEKIRELSQNYHVKVIIYLRRQDEMILSRYNQNVKGPVSEKRHFVEFKNESIQKTRGWLNYSRNINRWAKVFGKQNIIIRVYEKEQFYQHNIFSDFLFSVFGLELSDEFILPACDPNTRLHPIALEYRRLINNLPLSVQQKGSTLQPLKEISAEFYSEGREERPLLSPNERFDIIDKYSEENGFIAQEYLGRIDKKLFLSSIPEMEKHRTPCNVLATEDVSRINNYLMKMVPSVFKTILCGMLSCHEQNHGDAPQILSQLSAGIIQKNRFSLLNYLTPSSSKYNRLIDKLRSSYNDQMLIDTKTKTDGNIPGGHRD